MHKKFQFIEYSQVPKNSLNAKIENAKPRKGLWIKRSPSNNLPVFKTALANSATQLLATYFDYIHWPELGDKGMDYQAGVQKEIFFLEDFLFSKMEKIQELSTSLTSIKSNFVVTDFTQNLGLQLEQLQEQGFETLKFKVGKNFQEELKILLAHNLSLFEIRLDFNSVLEFNTIKDSYSYLKKIPYIEYCEDPCPFEKHQWQELNALLPLAFDCPQSQLSCSETFSQALSVTKHFILKPSRQLNHLELEQLIHSQKKITLTNMMDSTLGTWKCFLYLYFLKQLYPKSFSTPGLHTHHLYEKTFGSEFLAFKGANWSPSLEKLDLFLSHLNTLPWKTL